MDHGGKLVVAGQTQNALDGQTRTASSPGQRDIFLMGFTSAGSWSWTVQRGSSNYDLQAVALQAGQLTSQGSGLLNWAV